jgi:hypothetical protein
MAQSLNHPMSNSWPGLLDSSSRLSYRLSMPGSTGGSDRRRHARFEVDETQADLRKKGLLSSLGAGANKGREAVNLSEGGVRLRTSERIPPGTKVRVRIQIDRHKDTIEAEGVVRWTYQSARDKEVFFTGVEFAGEEPGRSKKITVMREFYTSPQYKAMKDSRVRKKE